MTGPDDLQRQILDALESVDGRVGQSALLTTDDLADDLNADRLDVRHALETVYSEQKVLKRPHPGDSRYQWLLDHAYEPVPLKCLDRDSW